MAAQADERDLIIRPVVMVVDDDPAVLQALEALMAPRLEPWFRIVTAESMPQAIALLDEEDDARSPLALAISDEKMPGGNGTELLVRLRQRPGHAHGGRILVTGYADLDSAKRAINDAEVVRYYPKPWDADRDLLPAVGEVLAEFMERRGLARLQLASILDWNAARERSLELRRAWWEYIHLMSLPALEVGVDVPDPETAGDAAAPHVLIEEWSVSGRLAIAAARILTGGERAIVEDVAFLPGAATDDIEALLLRAAGQLALRSGAAELLTRGSSLRADFFKSLGFAGPADQATAIPQSPMEDWLLALRPSLGDAWHRRFQGEGRLCGCAQTGCPRADYNSARRGYLCPLDLLEGRMPSGFPDDKLTSKR